MTACIETDIDFDTIENRQTLNRDREVRFNSSDYEKADDKKLFLDRKVATLVKGTAYQGSERAGTLIIEDFVSEAFETVVLVGINIPEE